MAILTLTSAGGAPGVTTLAVGLALTWPRPVILVDADPGAHQSVLAGYLGGRVSAGGRGLLRIAEAHRDRRPLREVVIDQAMPLADDDTTRRLFLPGFSKPGSAAHFGGVWPDLAEAFDRLADVDVDVIVDAGRLGPLGLPAALLERSVLTGLVLGSSLRAVMSARVHLPALREAQRVGGEPREALGLMVIGENRPYSASEIATALDLPTIATLPTDEPTARHLSDGAARHRRFDTSALVRALAAASSHLAARLQRSTDLVRS